MRKPHLVYTGLALVAVVALAACMPGANPMTQQALASAHPAAGFMLGLWHGIIIWVTFIASLFDHTVSVYEVHNNGWPYNLGFTIGAALLHGGSGVVARRRRADLVVAAIEGDTDTKPAV